MHYLFEGFFLDTERRELRRDGDLLPIEPKVFDLLVHLIANRDRVVSKDDLIAAIWGGRVVSETALTTCVNAVRRAVGDDGKAQRWIKTLPRKGLRFVGDVREECSLRHPGVGEISPDALKPALALPDKPSIAVLPFANLSGDPEQEYFVDGLVEDITSALSRIPWFFVTARNSSFTYKGRSIDIRQVGRELGVRYVLEGSVRKADDRLRISGQLIDAESGGHLWADHYDSTLANVFDLQDKIASSVANAIEPKLQEAEIRRSEAKRTTDLTAYDLYLRGCAAFNVLTESSHAEALTLFERAVGADPRFSPAYGLIVWCYAHRMANWWGNAAEARTRGLAAAKLALQMSKNDSFALSGAGVVLTMCGGSLEEAQAHIERAVALNPNDARAWGAAGWVSGFAGDYERSIECFMQAIRLSPSDPYGYSYYAGIAHPCFYLRRYDEAIAWADKALHLEPNFWHALMVKVAAAAMAERPAALEDATRRLLAVRPEFSISRVLPIARARSQREFFDAALRKAGLPE